MMYKWPEPVLKAMTRLNKRPIIFALSNPTDKAECTAEEAYGWTEGRAIFASGSPFPPVHYGGKTIVPGQCNNAYIFPGIGLGVVASKATRVTDGMFLAAAKTLAGSVLESELARGSIYPSLSRIRMVSEAIAQAVAGVAYAEGIARAMQKSSHEITAVAIRDYIENKTKIGISEGAVRRCRRSCNCWRPYVEAS